MLNIFWYCWYIIEKSRLVINREEICEMSAHIDKKRIGVIYVGEN
jgi:hypothetical protein